MKNYKIRIFSIKALFVTALVLPAKIFAQAAAPAIAAPTLQDKIGVWGNPIFIILTLIAILLALIVSALSRALLNIGKKSIAEGKSTKVIAALLLSTFIFGAENASAQATAQNLLPTDYYGLSPINFWSLVGIIIIEIIAILLLLRNINSFLNPPEKTAEVVRKKTAVGKFIDSLSDLKPMEHEQQLLMQDHSYDGIQELDNGMPPWLKYMFIVTIIFGIGYLVNYHIFRTGMLQTAEYTQSIKDAELQLAELRKSSANNIDETNVKLLTDAADLKSGKEIYSANCVACHSADGGGLVGPNLTDNYWIHGGSINNIFKTIKYGVVEKGMKSWQADLTPSQMALVASYIVSLKGTKPANPKEPQGDLYSETPAVADTLQAKADSTITAVSDSATAVK